VDGVTPTRSLIEAIDGNTSLVAVSEVQSATGFRVDLRALSDRCRDKGARLFVNATQALGALRLDASEIPVDYVAAHGYKWLLGPRGAAWLYVRPDRLEELAPLAPSWKSVELPYDEYYGGPFEPAPDARKLDTSLAWFSWPGARAALELLDGFDAAAIERHCLDLARAFRDSAAARGMDLVPEEVPSQIVGVVAPDPDGLQVRLRERKVVAAVRGGFLRVGFHAFNDAADVEAALAALREAEPSFGS
ncbi:MAG: aminotransferase class V-fold PLP-dependent enzyme, partial [Actinomycetota bacterium]